MDESDEFPSEIQNKLESFRESIKKIENILEPLFKFDFENDYEKDYLHLRNGEKYALKMDGEQKKGFSSLCFEKDEFTVDDFSVDQFVSKRRKHVSLETLRDDLGVYLNVLRSSMIELINKDYADFVNLSSNLVGLDKSIANLCVPLGQLREEVLTVKNALEEALSTLNGKLREREQIRDKKILLQRTMFVLKGIGKLETLLNINYPSHFGIFDQAEMCYWSTDLIERVALDLTSVQFNLSKIEGLKVIEEARLHVDNIMDIFMNYLEREILKSGLQDAELLCMVLKAHSALNKIPDLETLFRKRIVKPNMENIFTDRNLQQKGLRTLYEDVLNFLFVKCKTVLEVTRQMQKVNHAVKDFNFVVNVVWPEVASQLEILTPSIFAPGNPKLFHQNYSVTMAFLERFESACATQINVEQLRVHSSYKSFMEKWNLLVYFQIRFQEIGGSFEEALCSPFTEKEEYHPFSLHATFMCWSSVQKCWSDSIYLPSLSFKFWKLTLQIFSRYITWVSNVLEAKPTNNDDSTIDSGAPHNNNDNRFTGNETEYQFRSQSTLTELVKLVTDTEILQKYLSNFLEDVIKPKLLLNSFKNSNILYEGFDDVLENLSKIPSQVGSLIVQDSIMQCSQYLKLVSDIPRLYRKTNREIPSKSSMYVTNVINQVENFLKGNTKFLSSELQNKWCLQILDGITQQYLSVTNDVLTSVKRTEDSLKRLKRARDKKDTTSNIASGVTDDDKIRLQLALDIESFGTKIETLGIKKSDVRGYSALVEIVEAARSSPASNS